MLNPLKEKYVTPHTQEKNAMHQFTVQRDVTSILDSIDKGHMKVRNNLSQEEYRSLHEIKNNKNLIIKPADKGGAIVVLDKSYYMEEIRTQLRDITTYTPIPYNPTFEIAKQIKLIVTHYQELGIIDSKLGDFLINRHPVTPFFYTLPKVHKNLWKPPGRPIVASINSLLSPLAITLEKILSPIVPNMKSFLKDTAHFLRLLRDLGPLPPQSVLVTMDVTSLYTSIGHQQGIEAVMKYLQEHTTFTTDKLSFCYDLLGLVLTKNFFLFEDQYYMQQKGTAMGSNVAPPYANIFMDFFENTFVYCHPLFTSHVFFWQRYIDDVFLIWTGDVGALLDFHNDLNSCTPNIAFCIQHDCNSINFLDTLVLIKAGGLVETDLYVKPTDKNSLLLYTSSHPCHVKKALPKSQHERFRRIVSNPLVRSHGHREMDLKFRDRSYPSSISGVSESTETPVRDKHNTSRIAFVNMFHPFKRPIHQSIFKHWSILQTSYPDIPEFNIRPLICNKRSDNLRNHLVRADVGSATVTPCQRTLCTPHNGTFPCLGCRQCSNVIKGDSFAHPRTGRRFQIKGHFTCDSTYVVYLIKCPCGLGYVGRLRVALIAHAPSLLIARLVLSSIGAPFTPGACALWTLTSWAPGRLSFSLTYGGKRALISAIVRSSLHRITDLALLDPCHGFRMFSSLSSIYVVF
ncbi:unnamed protein product [Ranitomeya imitator]|uniref:Reverse transcriptase domain-containing protein n=1 Tax=Ranitomeya imitator TaxID=111125 RepID=A0ABN9MEW4_9NEOB|nr:unnamed protein product [Ranitomeya imitator]